MAIKRGLRTIIIIILNHQIHQQKLHGYVARLSLRFQRNARITVGQLSMMSKQNTSNARNIDGAACTLQFAVMSKLFGPDLHCFAGAGMNVCILWPCLRFNVVTAELPFDIASQAISCIDDVGHYSFSSLYCNCNDSVSTWRKMELAPAKQQHHHTNNKLRPIFAWHCFLFPVIWLWFDWMGTAHWYSVVLFHRR